MSNLTISGPPEDGGADNSTAGKNHDDERPGGCGRDTKKRGQIPDIEACLQALARLPGLVALKIVTPAQANAMRASYREILQHHEKKEARFDRQNLSDVNVMDLLRKDPAMLSMLEPILTDEQIAMVMGGATDGNRGQT